MTYDDLWTPGPAQKQLDPADERRLIAEAQAGDKDSSWALLMQYRNLLQSTARRVDHKGTNLTREQVEDLRADLVATAIEVIAAFDLERYSKLSHVLAARLKDVALEMRTALTVPRGTLALWFKIRRSAETETEAARNAPDMGMSYSTFMAIWHALETTNSEWATVPYAPGVPTADQVTYDLAQQALALLSPAERDVIEHAYGFRGDPKSDDETALTLGSTKGTVKTQRQRAIAKMREGLGTDRPPTD